MEKFKIKVWWYELYGNTVEIEAKDLEGARELVLKDISDYLDGDKTFCDFGEMGIDGID